MAQDRNTEELIIEAAKKIFVQRGLAGARMQDIADEAGINKAMLHYYYRSKEKLFEIVFNEALGRIIGRLGQIAIDGELPLEQKIRGLVESYIAGVAETPYLPIFVINEINQRPDLLVQRMQSLSGFSNIMSFMKDVIEAGKRGEIKQVSPIQLFLNIVSMCIFPFAAKPLVQGVLQLDNVQFNLVIEERKKLVADVILAWLKP
ncbi:TetR/AcrR family transcriptional regulator [Chitinophaga tropicalis]|uniref:TetR family transcriptional regulator n=1 Tax=Chitinophaga tropicalis TaxID=2683588 RepID=A0A7K1U1M5_9BACT|nr:TetR/AcrR family transcriptional regulator [Chitinophaga tropicalis]MVT08238.1 TetR family transcriptional regulator [Chitinophaga tropicalis]